jgi:S-adenosylmethionine decarboxylase
MYEFSCWLRGDEQQTLQTTTDALQQSGHTVLSAAEHVFEPQGLTMVWLLAESHCALHTYPEHAAAYVQISSCSKEKYDNFIAALQGVTVLPQFSTSDLTKTT